MKNQESLHNKIVSAAIVRRELTKRESEVLKLVAQGYKNREIAKDLGLAVKTVDNHRVNIMNKLGLRNAAQLIRYAIQKGVVSIENE